MGIDGELGGLEALVAAPPPSMAAPAWRSLSRIGCA
jgi:hypothetical protein